MCNQFWNRTLCLRTEPNFSSYNLIDHCGEELRFLIDRKGRQIGQQICHSKIRSEGEGNVWKLLGGWGSCPEISWSCWTCWYLEFYHSSADFEVLSVGIPYWKSWVILVWGLCESNHHALNYSTLFLLSSQVVVVSCDFTSPQTIWNIENVYLFLFLKEFQVGKIWRSPRCFLFGDVDNDLFGGLHQFCLVVDCRYHKYTNQNQKPAQWSLPQIGIS